MPKHIEIMHKKGLEKIFPDNLSQQIRKSQKLKFGF